MGQLLRPLAQRQPDAPLPGHTVRLRIGRPLRKLGGHLVVQHLQGPRRPARRLQVCGLERRRRDQLARRAPVRLRPDPVDELQPELRRHVPQLRPLAAVPGFGTRLDGVQGAALLDLGIERRRHPRAVPRQMASRRSQCRPLRSRYGVDQGILRIHGPLPEEQFGVQPREHVVPASQEHRDRLHAAQVQARIDDEPARLCQRIQPVHDHRCQVCRSGAPRRRSGPYVPAEPDLHAWLVALVLITLHRES